MSIREQGTIIICIERGMQMHLTVNHLYVVRIRSGMGGAYFIENDRGQRLFYSRKYFRVVLEP